MAVAGYWILDAGRKRRNRCSPGIQKPASRNSPVCGEDRFKVYASSGHGMPCPYMRENKVCD